MINEGPKIPSGPLFSPEEDSKEEDFPQWEKVSSEEGIGSDWDPGPDIEREEVPINPEQHSDLVAQYLLFKNKIKPKDDLIYHPCGANDISPSVAFPNSRIIYVDIDEKTIDALKKDGFEAYSLSALEFNPGEVDILIMLNPMIPPDIPSSYVLEGGFVLSNDYHQTASSLRQDKNYKLRAIIREVKKEEFSWETENLEDYWEEVTTEEEFKKAYANFYEFVVELVEIVTGKKENVLAEYKRIIERAREEQRKKNPKLISLEDLEREGLPFVHNGEEFLLGTELPRKKGSPDDIFVFQKVKPDPEVKE